MIMRRLLAGLVLAALPSLAHAGDAPVDLAGAITVDVASVIAGGGDGRLRVLSNIDLTADADLAALAGWQGAQVHFHVLDNRGARPNDSAATLQGVDNIEVSDAGLRLFEAWIEQDLGQGASLRAGLYDLNSEFYANDAAGVLLAPPFGIGSELAATGPNGPSIFPYSALAARLYLPLGGGYA
ncbi:MAG: porin, partial [Novosphingobium sp.]|nr:porin [Novosphingobium sp.]